VLQMLDNLEIAAFYIIVIPRTLVSTNSPCGKLDVNRGNAFVKRPPPVPCTIIFLQVKGAAFEVEGPAERCLPANHRGSLVEIA